MKKLIYILHIFFIFSCQKEYTFSKKEDSIKIIASRENFEWILSTYRIWDSTNSRTSSGFGQFSPHEITFVVNDSNAYYIQPLISENQSFNLIYYLVENKDGKLLLKEDPIIINEQTGFTHEFSSLNTQNSDFVYQIINFEIYMSFSGTHFEFDEVMSAFNNIFFWTSQAYSRNGIRFTDYYDWFSMSTTNPDHSQAEFIDIFHLFKSDIESQLQLLNGVREIFFEWTHKVYRPEVIKKVSIETLGPKIVGETYNFILNLSRNEPGSPVLVFLDMKRASSSDWTRIYTSGMYPGSTLNVSRTTMSPGIWDVKMTAIYDRGTPIEYDSIRIHESYPDRGWLLYHAFDLGLDSLLWKKTINFAQENASSRQVKEFGALVYVYNGQYGYKIYEGETIALDGNDTYDSMIIDVPCDNSTDRLLNAIDTIYVGVFHTRVPYTYGVSGLSREVGPTDIDNQSNAIGYLIDYKNRITSGHDINEEFMLYLYGPHQRELPR